MSLESSNVPAGLPPLYFDVQLPRRRHERLAPISATTSPTTPSPVTPTSSSRFVTLPTSSIKSTSRLTTLFRNAAMDKPYKRLVTTQNPARVMSLVQCPDDNELIAGLATGYFKGWKACDGTDLYLSSKSICRPVVVGRLSCIAYSCARLRGRDTTATAIYVAGSELGIVARHPAIGGFARTMKDNRSPILCIDANDKRMATLTRSHEVISWGVLEYKQHKARIWQLHRFSPAACTCSMFSSDGRTIVSGMSSGTVLLSNSSIG